MLLSHLGGQQGLDFFFATLPLGPVKTATPKGDKGVVPQAPNAEDDGDLQRGTPEVEVGKLV